MRFIPSKNTLFDCTESIPPLLSPLAPMNNGTEFTTSSPCDPNGFLPEFLPDFDEEHVAEKTRYGNFKTCTFGVMHVFIVSQCSSKDVVTLLYISLKFCLQ